MKYSEMFAEPRVVWVGQELLVATQNSRENSALSIYKINHTIDFDNKIISLTGWQGVRGKYKTEFKIKMPAIKGELSEYKINWVDPDGRTTTLSLDSTNSYKRSN